MRGVIFIVLTFISCLVNAQTEFKIEQNELILPAPILFETGSEKIRLEESKVSLQHIKAFLEAKTYITLIRIEGHTDNNGNESVNQKLTEVRSKSVYTWLVENGVDCKRLIAVGFGSTKPKADNSTAEGKAQNRRISICMAELRNKAIGGMPIDGSGIISATCR
jgi:OOP family OmpA-OmpF porin